MRATVTNKEIVISDPAVEVLNFFREHLSYEDRAKKYQLKRMSKSPYLKNTPAYKALEKQVYGTLLDERQNNEIAFSSGFYDLIRDMIPNIVDNRVDTGLSMSFPWKEKPFDLRPYQQEAVNLMTVNWRGLVNLATGMGKTLTAIYAIREIKRKTLVICPGKSVAKQFYKGLCKAFGDHRVGFYGDGKKKISDITVGIASSVNNDIEKFQKAELGLIIVDEVHHMPANTFYTIALALRDVGRVFGLTATDYRSDGKDVLIHAGCGGVIIKRDVVWGVKNGWLAQPYFIVRRVATTGHQYKDDKIKNYKEHVLKSDVMKTRIQSDIQKFLTAGKSVLCLVDEVEHGKELSEQLGLPFATGDDKLSEEYVEQLNAGKIPGLIGTDSKIGEGTDTERVDVLVLANFVASKGPVVQALGRGLRIYPGKDSCIVLDYIPEGSDQLKRHAERRVEYYKEITENIRIV